MTKRKEKEEKDACACSAELSSYLCRLRTLCVHPSVLGAGIHPTTIAYAFAYAAFFCAHLVSVLLLAKILARRDFDKIARGTCGIEAVLRHLQTRH